MYFFLRLVWTLSSSAREPLLLNVVRSSPLFSRSHRTGFASFNKSSGRLTGLLERVRLLELDTEEAGTEGGGGGREKMVSSWICCAKPEGGVDVDDVDDMAEE